MPPNPTVKVDLPNGTFRFATEDEVAGASNIDRLRGMGVTHIEQYLGVWAILEEHFRAGAALVNQVGKLEAHMAQSRGEVRNKGNPGQFELTSDGVAIIEMVGAMTKFGSSLSDLRFGTIGLRKAFRDAAAASDVKSILFVVDSPGGTVAGTSDLAADVRAAAEKKPVTTIFEDTGASAAFWVGAQASRVVATDSTLTGGIGTFMVVQDFSGFFEAAGVKTHVVRAGEFKGVGAEGTEVTEEQLQELQRTVNEINELFIKAVAEGRGMTVERARELADGRVHVGRAAVKLGLVDAISTVDAEMERLARGRPRRRAQQQAEGGAASEPTTEVKSGQGVISAAPNKKKEERPMSETKEKASFEDLKSQLPGADADFICEALEAGWTLDQARSEHMERQQKQIADANAKLAEAQRREAESAAKAPKDVPGVAAVGTAPTKPAAVAAADSTAASEWKEQLATLLSAGMPVGQATRQLVKTRPDLHKAYLEEFNAAGGRPVNLSPRYGYDTN